MTMRTRFCLSTASLTALFAAAPISLAQSCDPGWEAGLGGMIQPGGELLCAAMFDDGSGPALYIGATSEIEPFGLPPSGVGRIINGRLEILPGLNFHGGAQSRIRAMFVHDDGSGPALYVAGVISFMQNQSPIGIVRWRDGVWQSVGDGLEDVRALAVFDEDGDGPAPPMLFAGGYFGELATRGIARWDGESWSHVGGGLGGLGSVSAMVAGDDGSGPALYIGGSFATVGGIPAHSVARWNGLTWSAVGAGLPPSPLTNGVRALAWHDDGSGRALYAGGGIITTTADGVTYGIARWKGEQWGSLGLDEESVVRDVASQTINGVDELLIVGELALAGAPVLDLAARWTGETFEALPGQPRFRFPLNSSLTPQSTALAAHEDGILVLGKFDTLDDGVVARSIAVWDGEALRPYIDHLGLADVSEAPALAVDPESGALYLGGNFAAVGGHFRPNIARLDEQGWASVGDGLDGNVSSLVFHDDGSGPRLFAGGNFASSGEADLEESIAVFDGVEWSRVATLNTGEALALASIEGELYAGGNFGSIDGLTARRIARRDGTGWHALGAGLSGGSAQVRAIIPWNGGVVVGGSFTNSAGLSLRNVAFWDGEAWSPMDEGLNFTVRALAEFRGDLYAGGDFTMSGERPVRYLARWNGARWRPLPVEVSGAVRALRVFDDGSGPALYAAGQFGVVGGAPWGSIARWDGEVWSALGGGVTGRIDALATYSVGADRSGLFASGVFTAVDGESTLGIATWRGCFAACPGDANGDQSIDMADLMIVVDAFNTSEGDALFNASADFDQNGAVDFEDLNRVIAGFNQGC